MRGWRMKSRHVTEIKICNTLCNMHLETNEFKNEALITTVTITYICRGVNIICMVRSGY